jgi:hypothetical protein
MSKFRKCVLVHSGSPVLIPLAKIIGLQFHLQLAIGIGVVGRQFHINPPGLAP